MEQIRVDINRNKISGKLNLISIKQNETIILYLPALQLSAYGESLDETKEMLLDSLRIYCKNLLSLPKVSIHKELVSLGFQPNPHFNKKFTRPHIDENGDLQGLDLDGDVTVEKSMMAI
jgi:hypothetical protein